MTGANIRTVAAGFALLAALAITACNGDAKPAAPGTPHIATRAPAPAKKGPTAEQLTAGMVEAAAQDSSTSPLELKFELAQKPKVGQILEINLALLSATPLSATEMQVTGSEGFDVPPGSAHFEVPATEQIGLYRHTLRLTPTTEGVLFVTLAVSAKRDEVVDSKAFSIPVIAAR
jgi:hypothetical protein